MDRPLTALAYRNYTHVASSCCHAFAYCAYVWLVSRAGAVFTAQVAYFVTAWGVVWSILILGEETSRYLWLSLAFMFFGMFLVLPKNNRVKTKSNVRVH